MISKKKVLRRVFTWHGSASGIKEAWYRSVGTVVSYVMTQIKSIIIYGITQLLQK